MSVPPVKAYLTLVIGRVDSIVSFDQCDKQGEITARRYKTEPHSKTISHRGSTLSMSQIVLSL